MCSIWEHSLWECIEIQGIPQNVAIKNLEDTEIRIFKKLEYQSTSA